MGSSEDTSFARLVSLACHDLRTPLATVSGFARTLTRMQDLGEPLARYLGMIEAGADQLAELLDDLSVVARIEGGRYDPPLRAVDTLELARAVARRLGEETVVVAGRGGAVAVDPEACERAIYNLARCAIRHAGLDRLELTVERTDFVLRPVPAAVAPIILGEDLRDLGAAVANRVVAALGGSRMLEGETLRVRLPPSLPEAA